GHAPRLPRPPEGPRPLLPRPRVHAAGVRQRPRRERRPGAAGALRAEAGAPRPPRPAAPVAHLLGRGREPRRGRARPRPAADGPRLRVGDVDGPAAEPRAGRRRCGGGPRGALRQGVRPRPPGVDGARPQRAGAHLQPRRRDRREGRGAVPALRRGGERVPRTGRGVGRAGVGRMTPTRRPSWKWWVCGALLLATFLNYMDRQALAVTLPELKKGYHLGEKRVGLIEGCFGFA